MTWTGWYVPSPMSRSRTGWGLWSVVRSPIRKAASREAAKLGDECADDLPQVPLVPYSKGSGHGQHWKTVKANGSHRPVPGCASKMNGGCSPGSAACCVREYDVCGD